MQNTMIQITAPNPAFLSEIKSFFQSLRMQATTLFVLLVNKLTDCKITPAVISAFGSPKRETDYRMGT